MKPEMTPLIPVEQVLISFAGHTFVAVRLPDGRIAVVLRQFCEVLSLDRWGQIQRIQEHPVLSKCLLVARIQTDGGPQDAQVLVVWALPLWLGGFDLTRLSEEKRELIMLLQTDAVDAFTSHFYKVDAQARPQQQTQTPQPPPPLSRPEQAPTSLPELLRTMADRVEQDQRENTAWRGETERRVRILEEEREALWATITTPTPATPDALTADHLRTLHLLLRNCNVMTGQPIADLEQELAALLGVADLLHIPEAAWDRLFAWFWQRTPQRG